MSGPQLTDLGAEPAALPLFGERVSTMNALEESAWPHRSSDLEIPEVIREVKDAIDKLDARHILTEIDGFFLEYLSAHATTPPRLHKQGIEAGPSPLIKPDNGLTTSVRRIGAPC